MICRCANIHGGKQLNNRKKIGRAAAMPFLIKIYINKEELMLVKALPYKYSGRFAFP